MDSPTFAYLLIAAGIVLMGAELVIPAFGGLFAVGLGGLIIGMVLIFRYDATQGLVTLIALFVVVPLAGMVLLHYWPRLRMNERMMLGRPDDDATVAEMPANLELEQLRGRYGRTLSPLRPAGVTDFDGRRVDTLSDGPLIEAGRWVRCVDVRGGRVLVREVAGPPDLEALFPTES